MKLQENKNENIHESEAQQTRRFDNALDIQHHLEVLTKSPYKSIPKFLKQKMLIMDIITLYGSGALYSKMVLVRIIRYNKNLYSYFRSGQDK